MTQPVSIGAVVKSERLARGWTQEKLAELAGLGVRTLQRIETDGVISLRSLQAIAAAFEIDTADLERKATEVSTSHSLETPNVDILPRVRSGTELAYIVGGVEMASFDHEELESQEEVDLVAGFLQELQDIGDLWIELEAGHRVQFTYELQQRLSEIGDAGFAVFGKRAIRACHFPRAFGDERIMMSTAIIQVLRADSPKIVRFEEAESVSAVY